MGTKEIELKKKELAVLEAAVVSREAELVRLNDTYAGKCFSYSRKKGKTRSIHMVKYISFALNLYSDSIYSVQDEVSICAADSLYPATFGYKVNSQDTWSEYSYSNIHDAVEIKPAIFDGFTEDITNHLSIMVDRVQEVYDLTYQRDETPVSQTDPVTIDIPHLIIEDINLSDLRSSPFLQGNIFFLTPNSIHHARELIYTEIDQSRRGSEYYSDADWRYVERTEARLRALLEQLPV